MRAAFRRCAFGCGESDVRGDGRPSRTLGICTVVAGLPGYRECPSERPLLEQLLLMRPSTLYTTLTITVVNQRVAASFVESWRPIDVYDCSARVAPAEACEDNAS